jgi:hypothetical protein
MVTSPPFVLEVVLGEKEELIVAQWNDRQVIL